MLECDTTITHSDTAQRTRIHATKYTIKSIQIHIHGPYLCQMLNKRVCDCICVLFEYDGSRTATMCYFISVAYVFGLQLSKRKCYWYCKTECGIKCFDDFLSSAVFWAYPVIDCLSAKSEDASPSIHVKAIHHTFLKSRFPFVSIQLNQMVCIKLGLLFWYRSTTHTNKQEQILY